HPFWKASVIDAGNRQSVRGHTESNASADSFRHHGKSCHAGGERGHICSFHRFLKFRRDHRVCSQRQKIFSRFHDAVLRDAHIYRERRQISQCFQILSSHCLFDLFRKCFHFFLIHIKIVQSSRSLSLFCRGAVLRITFLLRRRFCCLFRCRGFLFFRCRSFRL